MIRQITDAKSAQQAELKKELSDVNHQISGLLRYRERLDREYRKLGGK